MSNQNGSKPSSPKQTDLDNRSRQLNPNDPVYQSSRGLPRPEQPKRGEGNVGDDFEQFGLLGNND
jgi:hypothetical protein